jgi:hypothetical protein
MYLTYETNCIDRLHRSNFCINKKTHSRSVRIGNRQNKSIVLTLSYYVVIIVMGSRGRVLDQGPGRVIAVRRWHRPGSGLAWGSRSGSLLKGGGSGPIKSAAISPGVINASYIASFHPRPSVRGKEP